MNITRGKKIEAQKVVVYGPEGIGKSTFAAQFPNPLFIDTEGSTINMDVARMDRPSSFTMMLQQIKYIKNNLDICSTLVIDTVDWGEQLCMTELCSKKQITGIEDIGYGKGYVYLAEDFGRMLNLLEEVRINGINIVINAHAQMRKFEQPDELGAYDRWELKLQKRNAALLKEWADILLFANYKTYVVNVDNQGAQKGKNKVQGGMRIMYTQHHPCWDAKNRHGLPEEIPMDYSAIASCIPIINKASQPLYQEKETEIEKFYKKDEIPIPNDNRETDIQESKGEAKEKTEEKVPSIPKQLLDLMNGSSYKISEKDIQDAVTARGYFPEGTPICNYGSDFINGVLIGAWDKVVDIIRELKIERGEFFEIADDELPFN